MMNKGKISFGKIGFSLSTNLAEKKDGDNKGETSNAIINQVPQSDSGGFGSFGKNTIDNKSNEEKVDKGLSVSMTMGFSGFGKKARNFDIEQMLEASRRHAEEMNKRNIESMTAEEIENKYNDKEHKTKPTTESKEEIKEESEEDEDDLVGPPLPPGFVPEVAEEDDDDEEDSYKLPVGQELVFNHGARTASAVAIDPSGSRLVTGGLDYEVKCWDFLGMNAAFEPFRTFCPADGYPINSIDYSCTGDKILIVSGSQQAKVYDRDGIEVYECVRGDMYIHDMAKTKGHIAGLTSGTWHPKDKSEFMTSARDGTVRLWRINETGKQLHVVKPRANNGLKTIPTVCKYSRDGLLVACACDDGSIQMWDHRKNFVNTTSKIMNAHQRGTETSGMEFSYDNKHILTRGGDDTLKLWDVRSKREPVNTIEGLFNRFSMTDCLFSPNDKLVITGTSKNRGEDSGKLLMYDRNTFKPYQEMQVGESHVVRIAWHPKLNQIAVGCGDGNVYILYDNELSHNGAVLVAGKRKKKPKVADVVISQQIITPHALPMFRVDRHRSTRKAEEKDRLDPVKSRQPELPIGKAGSGGRVASGGSTLSSYIIRNMGLRNKAQEDEDPRQALLKHAKAAAENPYWVTPAYSKNQPETIFQENAESSSPNKKQKTS